jgi:uncharacterized DUF497 family protein
MITWTPAKRVENIRKHGVDFVEAKGFDFITALIEEDQDVRGERRFRAIGWIGDRLYFLVYTLRGDDTHVISLRLATKREYRRYAEEL